MPHRSSNLCPLFLDLSDRINHFELISFSLSLNCQFSHIFGFLLPQGISFKLCNVFNDKKIRSVGSEASVIRLCTHKIIYLASPLKVNCGFLLPKQIGGNFQNSLPLDKKNYWNEGARSGGLLKLSCLKIHNCTDSVETARIDVLL